MEIKNKFYFEWQHPYFTKAKSDIFYCEGYHHNPVVVVKYNGKEVMIACDGEMNFPVKDVRITSSSDLEEAGIKSDADWSKLQDEPDFGYWGSFPWFDAYEWSSDNQWDHLDMVNGSIDDAILQVQRYLLGLL